MAQTAAVKQSKVNARAQKQLGHNTWRKAFMQHYWLYIMMLPALLYMIIFNYLPMTGLYMAFTDFSPFNGDTILESVFGSPFVGLKYFKKLFTGPDFWTLFRNTLSISLANLFFAFPAPIILALILNELRCKWFKRTAQTLVYIPHFVSIVIVAALTFQMFSTTDGAIYHVLTQIFGANAPDLLSDPKLFPALIVGQNIWKETGYGTIIYLAALTNVSPDLHEAAEVDGASRLQRLIHVDFPALLPTITIMLILRMGAIMSIGFEKTYLMQNSLNLSRSEIISTFVYKKGLASGAANDYSYSAAVGMFNSVVNLVLIVGVNWISRKISENSLW